MWSKRYILAHLFDCDNVVICNAIYTTVVLNATYSGIMYLIIILTIEINNDNNKNDIVWLFCIIIVLLFPIAATCRSTRGKEVILHSFKCYLHENLDLIIIFFTLLQFV